MKLIFYSLHMYLYIS